MERSPPATASCVTWASGSHDLTAPFKWKNIPEGYGMLAILLGLVEITFEINELVLEKLMSVSNRLE